MEKRTVNQSLYLFYSDASVPYRGFVKKIGYVDRVYKDYLMLPYKSETMSPGSPMYGLGKSYNQGIGYIPSIDTSPSKVIRSYGKEASDIIENRIVRKSGNNVTIDLGNHTLKLSNKNYYKIESDIKNEYQQDAEFQLSVRYEDNNGVFHTIKNNYPLDGLPCFFPNVNWQDLYTCQPESFEMSNEINNAFCTNNQEDLTFDIPFTQTAPLEPIPQPLDLSLDLSRREVPLPEDSWLRKGINATAPVAQVGGYVSGVLGTAGSWAENKGLPKYFSTAVEKYSQLDYENICNEFRPGIQQRAETYLREQARNELRNDRRFFKKSGKFIKDHAREYENALHSAYQNASAQAAKIADSFAKNVADSRLPKIVDKLKNGIDPRVSKATKLLKVLRVANPVLNVIGLVSSIGSLAKQISDLRNQKEPVTLRQKLKTVKLGVDCLAAGVAFIPGWGWAVAGLWFAGSTVCDLAWDYIEGN